MWSSWMNWLPTFRAFEQQGPIEPYLLSGLQTKQYPQTCFLNNKFNILAIQPHYPHRHTLSSLPSKPKMSDPPVSALNTRSPTLVYPLWTVDPWLWCGVDVDDRPVGNPKRRYDEHSSKFFLSKKPRFIKPVGKKPNFRRRCLLASW
jgi:hypothetical protein